MRVGYRNLPGGDSIEMTVAPVAADGGQGWRGARSVAALAAQSADELIRNAPLLPAMLTELAHALVAQRADAPNVVARTDHLSDVERALLFDLLGEGEVAGIVALPDRRVAQIQESVFAGLWRVRIEGDADISALDYLEIGAAPEIALRAAHDFAAPDLTIAAPPEGAMNVMPVLAEIRAAMAAPPEEGRPQHIVNLTLLPMTEADAAHLSATLGAGPVQMTSRGYGSCRVQATGARRVWSAQFLNSEGKPVLDTIEIGAVPATVSAADEDFADSSERLQQIVEAYFR